MTLVRSTEGLKPLAEQIGGAMAHVQAVAPQGFLGFSWEANTHKQTKRNNEALADLPVSVRVSTDVARQCVEDEVRFNENVDEIFSQGINLTKELKVYGKVIALANIGMPIDAAREAATAFIRALRETDERVSKYKEAADSRHGTLGPILETYALCEDAQGYYLEKAPWVTHEETLNSGMGDVSSNYTSVPSKKGIDVSVDVGKLLSGIGHSR